jgi:putative DNA primase/helicase
MPKIVTEGVPYKQFDHYFQEIRKKSNHLWEFVEEVGIVEAQGEKIYISDLWLILQEWYQANGTLEILQPETDKGRPKLIWHEQLRRFDRPIKGANQIFDAFSNLFPKITKQRETADQNRVGKFYLAGLKLDKTASCASYPDSARITASLTASYPFISSSLEEEKKKEENKQLEINEAVNEAINEAIEVLDPLPDGGMKHMKQFGGGYATPEVPAPKLTKEKIFDLKKELDTYIPLLGWDSAKLTECVRVNFDGKTKPVQLSESEGVRLIELLNQAVAKLAPR